jgi:hypothetical protein
MSILRHVPLVLVVLVVLAGVAVFVFARSAAGRGAAGGPVEVVWDHEPCAHCRMHVGDPAFAAQLHTADGRVLHFDDPGCAILLMAERADGLRVKALYFHHLREDRWLAADESGFVAVKQSPMGFGFGAVSRAEPGAISLDQFRSEILQEK